MGPYLQSQGYIISSASFGGMGPLTTDWQSVQSATEATLQDFRDGVATLGYIDDPLSNDPFTGENTPLIAVQKVDVVAHSYGGLLTRWYMEQAADSNGVAGSEFKDFRNVRSLVELGTPNLGSPLANLVDEVYSGTPLGQTIANATVRVAGINLPASESNVIGFLGWLAKTPFGGLPTSSNGITPYPFYEDDSVDSPLLQQLNGGSPFNANVSYAAVVGTGTDYKGIVNLYADVQPLAPNGQSYFPWLQLLDGANNDSIVPTWSALLPDQSYDKKVPTDHVDLESNLTTEADVLAFLANPNLPLGSAQRAAAGSNGWQPPISDRNAYSNSNKSGTLQSGTNAGQSTEVSGAGLNPDAIVGVQLDKSNYDKTTWDAANPADTGAQYPVFTGMIQEQYMTSGVNLQVNGSTTETTVSGVGTSINTVSKSLGNYFLTEQSSGQTNYLTVNAAYLQNAGATDWIPFSIITTPIGRGVSQNVSGPGGSLDVSQTGFADISFTYYGNGTGATSISSASTELDVPAYAPPVPIVSAPNAQNQVTVTLDGAYQVQPSGSGTYATVSLYSGVVGSDTELAQTLYNDINPAGTAVYWTGLAISYIDTVTLALSNNNLTGPLGSAPWNDGLFQQLEQSIIGKLDSGDSYVPGS